MVPVGREYVQTRCNVSRMVEIEVQLLSNANKSYMSRRLAQQRMTLSDLKWLFHGSSVPHRALFLQ